MTPIILDCDDVLLDWIGDFAKWLGKDPSQQPQTWDLSQWAGLSQTETLDQIKQFNASAKFCELKAVDGAYDALSRLSAKGHPLYVLTSCGVQAKFHREVNLRKRFGRIFAGVICLDLGVSKRDSLAAFYTLFGQCYWIEDNYGHASVGNACGHKSIMLRRPHNLALESKCNGEIKWCSNWPEIVTHLI